MSSGLAQKKTSALSSWVILVVDDDEGVQEITELTLSQFQPLGKPLTLLRAYSGAEANEVLKARPDIALIFLDVVMETNDAGLKIVDFIRKELGNQSVRIIIRTGMPGDFPEEKVLLDYDINEYWEKTEFTSKKIKASVLQGLRNYRDILEMKGAQNCLRKMIYQLPDHLENQSLIEVTQRFFKHLDLLLQDIWEPKALESGFLISLDKGKLDYQGVWSPKPQIGRVKLKEQELALAQEALSNLEPINRESIFCFPFQDWRARRMVILITWAGAPENLQLDLAKIAAYQFSRFVNNKNLLDALDEEKNRLAQSLDEKTLLLREIHHRVKNNLQTISSLLNLSESELEKDPHRSFQEAQARIMSVALIHEHIYRSQTLEELMVGSYLDALIPEAVQQKQIHPALKLELPESAVRLGLAHAIPFGLLIMEIFALTSLNPPEKPPGLEIRFGDGRVNILLTKLRTPFSSGTNLTLIKALCQQLDAQVHEDQESLSVQWKI